MANLCLVAKEDHTIEVQFESNSLNDLQEDYNDLYEESLKLVSKNRLLSKNSMLRKQIISLTNEHENELITKNNELKDKIFDLTKFLEKFTKGQKNLDLLLGSQRCVYDRAGLGYNPLAKQKLYKNIFVKPLPPKTQRIPCAFCNTSGHTIYSCHIKKSVKKGLKIMWVPKENAINTQELNKIWVPKTNV